MLEMLAIVMTIVWMVFPFILFSKLNDMTDILRRIEDDTHRTARDNRKSN
jgi:hypothetical protein